MAPLMPTDVTYHEMRSVRMKNKYKIDFNTYSADTFPYALYVKPPGIFSRWKHVASYKTKESAMALYEKLVGLPEYL